MHVNLQKFLDGVAGGISEAIPHVDAAALRFPSQSIQRPSSESCGFPETFAGHARVGKCGINDFSGWSLRDEFLISIVARVNAFAGSG